MRRLRDTDTNSAAYITWQKERQAEIEAEQKQIIDAQEAAIEADPVKRFEQSSNRLVEETLNVLRTGYIPDSLLPGVERLNGRAISNEDAAVSNFKFFAGRTSTFAHWMASQFLDIAARSDLAPIASNYVALHNLLLTWGIYDEPVQEAAPAVEEPAQQVLTPSQQAERNYIKRRTDVVVHDPVTGRAYTDFDLSQMDSKSELRLRRLAEGRIGSSTYDTYMDIQNIKAQQTAETAAKAAAEEQS